MSLNRITLVVFSIIVTATTVGCISSHGRTVEERRHVYKSVTRSEWQMAQDDFDHFMLMDRKSRLTRWH